MSGRSRGCERTASGLTAGSLPMSRTFRRSNSNDGSDPINRMTVRRNSNDGSISSLPVSRNVRRNNSNDGSIISSNGNGNNNGAPPSIQSNGSGASSSQRTGTTKGSSNSKKKAAEAAFYPKLITAQIIALQCLHYFLLAVCIQINSVLYSTSITIDRIFTDEYVRLWHRAGWADVTAILLVSLVGSVMLAIIVEKSKKCLDFAVTLFLIHLGMCTLYGGFPTVLDWWIVQVTGTILMVLLGEYLCSLRELSDIPLLQL